MARSQIFVFYLRFHSFHRLHPVLFTFRFFALNLDPSLLFRPVCLCHRLMSWELLGHFGYGDWFDTRWTGLLRNFQRIFDFLFSLGGLSLQFFFFGYPRFIHGGQIFISTLFQVPCRIWECKPNLCTKSHHQEWTEN